MTKKWTFSMQSETGGYLEFTTADTATTGTSYLITSARGSLNGKTIVGLVNTSTVLFEQFAVKNLVTNNKPDAIGLVDSTGAQYLFKALGSIYVLQPSFDIATWRQYETNSLSVITEAAPPPTPVVSGPTENADTLTGTSGNDTINALGGNDTVNSLAGNDAINGGSGNDTINSGDGDDNITLSTGTDTIDGGNGTDTLTLTGDLAANSISYNIATQIFSVRNEGYTSTFTNIEKIAVSGTTYSIVKPANTTTAILTGASGSDFLFGGSAREAINGGAGADVMQGGSGDDIYYVDNASDQIIESLEGGNDDVQSSVNFTLGANLESLHLVGKSNINGTGNDLENYIAGNDGNNVLNGKGGYNTLLGLKGNDTFIVTTGDNDVYGDDGIDTIDFSGGLALTAWKKIDLENDGRGNNFTIFEADGPNGFTSVWLYDKNTEKVIFKPSVGALSVTYTLIIGDPIIAGSFAGGSKSDMIIAGAGNDTLDGKAGTDAMFGGGGNDTYLVDSASDTIVEYAGEGSGIDTVQSTLGIYVLPVNVENLTLIGRGLNGTGNSLANILVGNSGKNSLSGGDGDDTLVGGTGQDNLTGGAGRDSFKFALSTESAVKTPDTITDFISGTDKVDLSGIDANSSLASDQAFTFIGSAAFSKVAGQLRFVSGVLTGDTNGDGVADFQINLTGLTALLVSDIVL